MDEQIFNWQTAKLISMKEPKCYKKIIRGFSETKITSSQGQWSMIISQKNSFNKEKIN